MLSAELTDVGLFGSMERFGDLCIHVVIDVRRAFSRGALERAAAAAIEAFPVLGCRYEPGFFRDRWMPVSEPVSSMVHVVEGATDVEAETLAWIAREIPLTRERPFRMVSVSFGGTSQEGSRLLLSISHLAVDGAGIAAVGHVIGASLYGFAPGLPPDARRSLRSTLGGLRLWHLPVLARDLAEQLIQPFINMGAAPRERPYPISTSERPSVRRVVVGQGDLARLKTTLGEHGASVNDILIAALARVSAARSRTSPRPVVVLYTMDLRRYAGEPKLRAANISSIMTAVVPREATADLASAARAVSRVTARHRRSLAGPAFLMLPLLMAFGLPHGLVRRMTGPMHAIAIDLPLDRGLLMTNVGKLDDGLRAFGGDLVDLRIVGPNVRGVSVPVIVAYGLQGELHLELFAPPGLAEEAVIDLEREILLALGL